MIIIYLLKYGDIMNNNYNFITKYDITLTMIVWGSYYSIINKAYNILKKELKDEYGLNINLKVYSNRNLSNKIEKFIDDAKKSDIVFIYRTASDDEIYNKINIDFNNLIITGQNTNFWNNELSSKSYLYTVYGGVDNFKNLILYLIENTLHLGIKYSEPYELPLQGIYYNGNIYDNLKNYLDHYPLNFNNPTMAILFSRHYLVNDDMEVINELLKKLNEHFNVVPIFTYGVKDEYIGALNGGECILKYIINSNLKIDGLINLLSFPLGSIKDKNTLKKVEGLELLKKLNVPVFHPIVSYYKSYDEWVNSSEGLSSEIWWSVALPEYEGIIEPIIIGTTENIGNLEKKMAIYDRVDKLVNRIKRWMNLKNKNNKDKKIIFILHNSACSSIEATVGTAAHLDTFQSMVNILKKLKEEGYTVENIPNNGDELAKLILNKKAICEFRWTTVDEIVSKGGALYLMDEEEYWEYFNKLPETTKNKVMNTWGDLNGKGDIPPAMIYNNGNKKKIVITGLKFGNIIIAVQPKRGCAGARCDGNVCKILHDPECPPTHQYIATYMYFNKIGDAIVHVGTHGSLEFLPGKNVGLSKYCYTDICIGDIPHIYIYNSDNPPEGTVAKRRSYATVIDHMQTMMVDSYNNELKTLYNYVEEYLKDMDKSRRHQLEHLIVKEVKKLNLPYMKEIIKQLEINDSIHDNFDELFRELRDTLEMIKNSKYNDGMHIFGNYPSGQKRIEYIRNILDFDYGDKYTKKELNNIISSVLLNNTDDTSNINDIDSILYRTIISINNGIENSMEMENLINSLDGKYIEPGPSGLITRGRWDILPTGRNFYSLNPYGVPTKSAHRIGILLAEKLIEEYINENSKYPESVGIYWMASDIMWSDGEGMAQILHLLGVKPKWKDGKIIGTEIIPLNELGRPRIDVVIRVSGILRDNFPNCMDLIDEAITKVAKLDEPLNMNYVKKHVVEGLKSGLSFRESTFRIFSSKPGTYGNGVKYAIYSSGWKNENDLKDAFIMWNSYAYGKNIYGVKGMKPFENILKTVDLTFNKVVSDEYDILGCCCYFGAHGGLTNTIKVLSNKNIKAYYGDTRNINNIAIRSLNNEIKRVSLSKLLNPKWIEGMKKHGYKGAGDISKKIGRLYGWSATTRDVDDWLFDEILNTYVINDENREFFKKYNPYALEEICRRLLEAYQRKLWKTDESNIEKLKMLYWDIEGDIEETYTDNIGDFQGGSIDISTIWKEKLKENI